MNDHRVIDKCRLVASYEEEAILFGNAPPLTGTENREGTVDKCRLIDVGESAAAIPSPGVGPAAASDVDSSLFDEPGEQPRSSACPPSA